MGNHHFEDTPELGDCKHYITGDTVRLCGLNLFGSGFELQVCVCVRSDDRSSFVSQHKNNH